MSEIRRRRKDNFSERIPLNVLKRETMASQLIKNWRSKIFLLLSILFSVFVYIYVRNSLFIPTNILQKSELPRSEIEDIYKEVFIKVSKNIFLIFFRQVGVPFVLIFILV